MDLQFDLVDDRGHAYLPRALNHNTTPSQQQRCPAMGWQGLPPPHTRMLPHAGVHQQWPFPQHYHYQQEPSQFTPWNAIPGLDYRRRSAAAYRGHVRESTEIVGDSLFLDSDLSTWPDPVLPNDFAPRLHARGTTQQPSSLRAATSRTYPAVSGTDSQTTANAMRPDSQSVTADSHSTLHYGNASQVPRPTGSTTSPSLPDSSVVTGPPALLDLHSTLSPSSSPDSDSQPDMTQQQPNYPYEIHNHQQNTSPRHTRHPSRSDMNLATDAGSFASIPRRRAERTTASQNFTRPASTHLPSHLQREMPLTAEAAARSTRAIGDPAGAAEEAEMVRQYQAVRARVPNKRVVSKAYVAALEKVDVSSLPEGENTCIICYNDFDVASPEGVVEHPTRLPKCKHIFGNACIEKWFKDSDTCPYCRDRLPSERATPDAETMDALLRYTNYFHGRRRGTRVSFDSATRDVARTQRSQYNSSAFDLFGGAVSSMRNRASMGSSSTQTPDPLPRARDIMAGLDDQNSRRGLFAHTFGADGPTVADSVSQRREQLAYENALSAVRGTAVTSTLHAQQDAHRRTNSGSTLSQPQSTTSPLLADGDTSLFSPHPPRPRMLANGDVSLFTRSATQAPAAPQLLANGDTSLFYSNTSRQTTQQQPAQASTANSNMSFSNVMHHSFTPTPAVHGDNSVLPMPTNMRDLLNAPPTSQTPHMWSSSASSSAAFTQQLPPQFSTTGTGLPSVTNSWAPHSNYQQQMSS